MRPGPRYLRPATPRACRAGITPQSNVGTVLHLAHGDSGSIPTRLLGRRRQVGEWDVGHPVGVQGERGGVVGLEALHELLGGKRAPTCGARLDPRALVDLIAEG